MGVGRCGPRLKTQTLLKLRADHAAARDGGHDGRQREIGL
ncbi:ethanolamine ammonia-lyase light chain EutC [Hungatella sp.]